MTIEVSDISWKVAPVARAEIDQDIVDKYGEDVYFNDLVPAFKNQVTAYIQVHERCDRKIGRTITPLGRTAAGGKLFKARLGMPGEGKSGGLRIHLALHCEDRECHVLMAQRRRDTSQADQNVASDRDWQD